MTTSGCFTSGSILTKFRSFWNIAQMKSKEEPETSAVTTKDAHSPQHVDADTEVDISLLKSMWSMFGFWYAIWVGTAQYVCPLRFSYTTTRSGYGYFTLKVYSTILFLVIRICSLPLLHFAPILQCFLPYTERVHYSTFFLNYNTFTLLEVHSLITVRNVVAER